MIYTMNGMVTQLNLQADEPGTFHGHVGAIQRRRLLRHALPVRAVRADEFAAWVQATRGAGPTLDAAALHGARAAEHERAAVRPIGAVTPDLFDQVVTPEAPARARAGDRARRAPPRSPNEPRSH